MFKIYLFVSSIFLLCLPELNQAHIVMTRDDRGGHLLLTDEDGGGGGGQGDNLVIASDGQNGPGGGGGGGGGQDSKFILQDADNREGDVVMNGKNIVIPGEDGHIVLADSRNNGNNHQQQLPPNTFGPWMPFMQNMFSRSMFEGYGGFSGFGGFRGFGGLNRMSFYGYK